MNLDHFLTPEQRSALMGIGAQRVAEYREANLHRAEHGYRIGSDTEVGTQHAPHLRNIPVSYPFGADPIGMLITEVRSISSVGVGQFRTVIPNPNERNALWPFVLQDSPETEVRGYIPRDIVYPGERVWAPGRGTVTIDRVVREDNRITSLIPRGDGAPITMWYRTTGLAPYGWPNVGDHILALRVPGREDAQGDVGIVTEVDRVRGRVYFDREHNGNVLFASVWLPLDSDKNISPGTIVLPMNTIPGALASFAEHALATPAEVMSYQAGYLHVRPCRPFEDMSEYNVMPNARIVGHIASPKKPEGWSKPLMKQPVEDAPVVEDGIDWKKKYDDLITALHEEAKERDWCSEFEDFCEANGVPMRLSEYQVTVLIEVTMSPSTADDVLGSWLNTDGEESDVRDEITITNRVRVNVETTAEALRNDDALDAIKERLTAEGYRYDDVEIDDWYLNN